MTATSLMPAIDHRPTIVSPASRPRGYLDPHHGDGLLARLAALPAGDPARTGARAAAIEFYAPIATSIARRYGGRGEPLRDLIQVATIGLIKAVDRFEASRGVMFASYAIPTILGEVKRHFRDATWMIRVPRRLQEARIALAASTEAITAALKRSPTVAELAASLGIGALEYDRVRQTAGAYRPLAPQRKDLSGDSYGVLDEYGAVDSGFEAVDRRLTVHWLLADLPARERRILGLRFVAGLTQAEIATRVGVSQMHVSRLLTSSLSRLRDRMAIADGGDGGPRV